MAEYTLFFTEDSPFSQWYRCAFTVDGVRFNCAEQFMMHGKAMLFGDAATAQRILAASHPKQHKALGRNVAPFVDATWTAKRIEIVTAGNRAKFTQNAELLRLLLATRGTELVEASPYDRIWGIGLAASSPFATDPKKWRGQNLLGKILTELRESVVREDVSV